VAKESLTLNASATTKDTRKPVSGREVTSVFRHGKPGIHVPPSNIGTCIIPPVLFWQIIRNLPLLFKLRKRQAEYRRKRKPDQDIAVAFYSDNLDEVNGIANNLRHVVPYMRAQGHKAYLVGSAFHTRPLGVVEDHYLLLLPRALSMEQLGYADSELAFPRIRPLLRLLWRYPIDLLELETPSPGAWLTGMCAKIMGIKVISHYRTDVPSYTRTLVKAKWMHRYVLWLMQVFYKHARPVVSPCRDYQRKLVDEIHIPLEDTVILPRGIPLERFHPDLRGKGVWESFASPTRKIRFVFVGRISKEKDIPFLEDLWKRFRLQRPEAELLFVGGGWYLDALRANFKDCPDVSFAGVQGGETLSALFADADFFIFPSGTDTFGNVVVESIASGTPVIVTDRGGPQDIIDGHGCGWILPFGDIDAWLRQLDACCALIQEQPGEYQAMRDRAYSRSQEYTLEKAVTAQWAFFRQVVRESYP